MKKILIVEDELGIQEFLNECLKEQGYEVAIANDGLKAIEIFRGSSFDLILLDIMLPEMDGYTVCKLIRQESQVPIIMLTAMESECNQLKGFDCLANDYITKPFSVPILLKRIEKELRVYTNFGKEVSDDLLIHKKIEMNIDSYEVFLNKKAIVLTSIEFKLLKVFLKNIGRVLTRDMLIYQVWDEINFESSEKIVNHHIMNLRKKVGGEYIETVRGVGYKFG